MPILLARIDDRLIHGQVVVGWGRPLGIQRIVLVDDAVAASAWEQDLYRMAVPPEFELVFASVADAVPRLAAWQADPRRTLLLAGDISTMAAVAGDHAGIVRDVNIGGIHHRAGRRQRLPYVYLTDEEYAALRALDAAGVHVTAQDVPTAAKVSLKGMA
ncbi:MAG TPA: PTS sugar transporter subunit IIB [Gemmatimonadales bacterium]|jgi:PTS system mannose-specific IIB component/fructoselysine and glucoselysine-specific PTS system IIB component|nr:PTS sugar transporter subunit IIB [Gemmatimonadales bacterium]